MWTGKKTQQATSQESIPAQQDEGARIVASDAETAGPVTAFVGAGVEFKGVIRHNSTVRIDGRLVFAKCCSIFQFMGMVQDSTV